MTPFEARKHRIERRRRRDKRARSDDDDEDFEDEADDDCREEHEGDESSESASSRTRTIPLSAIKGIKKQARYEPVVPMSKEELSEWRKEARRVRNRESAAASRRKTRERIEELEGQVQVLESNYTKALERIAELERRPLEIPSSVNASEMENQPPTRTVSPNISSTPLTKKVILPNWSLGSQEAAYTLAKSLDLAQATMSENQYHHHYHPSNPLMFSRPTAA